MESIIEFENTEIGFINDISIESEKGNLVVLCEKTKSGCRRCLGKKINGKVFQLTEIGQGGIELLNNGMAVIYVTEGMESLIDDNGKTVVPFNKYEGFSRSIGDYIVVYDWDRIGLIDKSGNVIIDLSKKFSIDKNEFNPDMLYYIDENGCKMTFNGVTKEYAPYIEPKVSFVKRLFNRK